MLKRIIENITWSLLNHPPTNITSKIPDDSKCEFCERNNHLWNIESTGFCICQYCITDAMRKILKKKGKE